MAENDQQRKGVSSDRRRFLAIAATAGLTGIAGCNESDDTNDDTEPGGETPSSPESGDGDAGGNLIDDTYTADCWGNPAEASFNPYIPRQGGYAGGFNPQQFMWLPLGKFSPSNSEYRSVLLEDWTIEPESATFNIHPDIMWHDGNPVTAQDVVTKFQLEKYVGNPLWDTLSSIEASGEKTVEFSLQEPTNPEIVKDSLLTVVLNTPASIFGDQLEAIRDTSSESARNEEVTALQEMTVDEAVGNGPYQLESRNQQRFLLSYFEDYPVDINIPNVELKFLTSNQNRWQEFREGNLDFVGMAVPPEVWSSFPDHKVFCKQITAEFSGLLVNHSDDVLGDVRVRKALLYAIDKETAANNFRPEGTPMGADPASATGLFRGGGPYPDQVSELLGDTADQFEQYGQDTDKAAALMNEAGYSKDGDTWQDADGNAVELPIKVGSGFSDIITMGRGVVGDLNSFGFSAELVTTDNTSLVSDLQTGDFRIALDREGAGSLVPFANYQELLASTLAKEGWKYPTADVTVPPFGEPGGTREPANISEKMNMLAEATDESQIRSATQDLAWVLNQSLPMIPLIQDWGGWTGSSDHWNVDTDSADWGTGFIHWALAKGRIQGKTE